MLLEQPWIGVIRPLVKILSGLDRLPPGGEAELLAATLDVPVDQIRRGLGALEEEGLLVREHGRLAVSTALTVDSASLGDRERLKAHWASEGLRRLQQPHPGDIFALNVFSGSEELIDRIRSLQRAYYRELRALVGDEGGEPEVVAVVNLQLFTYLP